jgi:GT2 family glycosyltransferase
LITLEAVTVNYFGADVVPRLVQSFLDQDSPDWRLVIVDNSASAAEFKRLTSVAGLDDRVTVVAAPSNLGYFGGAQWWVSQSPRAAEWLAVCNVDLWLADRSFVTRLGRMPTDASILAPDITALPSGRAQNPFMRRRPSWRHMLVRSIALSHRSSARAAWRFEARKSASKVPAEDLSAADIYAPHGAFVLFHRTYFESGGTLVHEPFLYFEEITVAERALDLRQRVRFEPSLRIVHAHHQATGEESDAIFRAQREGAIYARRLMSHFRKAQRRNP